MTTNWAFLGSFLPNNPAFWDLPDHCVTQSSWSFASCDKSHGWFLPPTMWHVIWAALSGNWINLTGPVRSRENLSCTGWPQNWGLHVTCKLHIMMWSLHVTCKPQFCGHPVQDKFSRDLTGPVRFIQLPDKAAHMTCHMVGGKNQPCDLSHEAKLQEDCVTQWSGRSQKAGLFGKKLPKKAQFVVIPWHGISVS